MRKNLMTLLFFMITNAAKNFTMNRNAYGDSTRIKAALLYLKVVKASRLLFLNTLGLVACLFFLLSSIVLFHITFFLYAPYSVATKMWVGFAFATVYMGVSVAAFFYICAEETWSKIFQAQNIIGKLEDKPGETS